MFVEGWTTLGAMLGVTPHEVSNTEQDGVYISVVELKRMSDGAVVSRASGASDELDRSGNPTWSRPPAVCTTQHGGHTSD